MKQGHVNIHLYTHTNTNTWNTKVGHVSVWREWIEMGGNGWITQQQQQQQREQEYQTIDYDATITNQTFER